MTTCLHVESVNLDVVPDPLPATDGTRSCGDCLREGSRWVHLRLCTSCGHVGCCDNSPKRHASGHFHSSQHPIVRSFEPREDWLWCYSDETYLRL
jgi:uncharacterized UBP type Zn finger protein